MHLVDQVPLWAAVLAALTLGLAPFTPEPHLFEKLRLLFDGALTRPVDILDLILHAAPWAFLMVKLARMLVPQG